MKGVRCSWVDMEKIRQALSCVQRGDQAQLGRLRCVQDSTVSQWRAVCGLLDALEGKVQISELCHFQPSHATEIARAFRKVEKDPSAWTEETKTEIAEWVDRCEAEELTVPQLREALRQEVTCTRPPPPPFAILAASARISKWLQACLETWPEAHRDYFVPLVRGLLDNMEADRRVEGRTGTGAP
jgi:hypothetical protein